jgi:hypothetical protein
LAKKPEGSVVLHIFDSGTFNVIHIDKASPPVVSTLEVGEYTITAGVITVPTTYTPNPLTFKVLPHPREPRLFTLKWNSPSPSGRKPERIIDGRQSPGK